MASGLCISYESGGRKALKTLTFSSDGCIIKPVDGRVRCPKCGKEMQRITPKTRAQDLPVYCRRCKDAWVLNIDETSLSLRA